MLQNLPNKDILSVVCPNQRSEDYDKQFIYFILAIRSPLTKHHCIAYGSGAME